MGVIFSNTYDYVDIFKYRSKRSRSSQMCQSMDGRRYKLSSSRKNSDSQVTMHLIKCLLKLADIRQCLASIPLRDWRLPSSSMWRQHYSWKWPAHSGSCHQNVFRGDCLPTLQPWCEVVFPEPTKEGWNSHIEDFWLGWNGEGQKWVPSSQASKLYS